MGLWVGHSPSDHLVSDEAFSASYSTFMWWRAWLAEAAGYETALTPFEPGRTATFLAAKVISDDRWTHENFLGRWEVPPEDPLLVLLVHSDSDGIIPASLCPFVAKRLEQLLPTLETHPQPDGHVIDYLAVTRKFIAGTMAAYDAGEDLEFG